MTSIDRPRSLPSTLALLLAALLVAAPAVAQERSDPIDVELDQLLSDALTTIEQITVIDRATGRWDGRMNELYRQLREKLPADTFEHLRDSQRRWIAFRDRELEALIALYANTEGTLFRPMYASDRLRLTRDRARQLQGWLDTWQLRDQ